MHAWKTSVAAEGTIELGAKPDSEIRELQRLPSPRSRQWVIACGALLMKYNHLSHRHFGGARPRQQEWIADIRDMLERDWSVTDMESAKHSLAFLMDGGHRRICTDLCDEYDARIREFGTAYSFRAQSEQHEWVASHRDVLTGKSLVAWDACRAICLAGWCRLCGYLGDDASWEYSLQAAHACQKHYRSWQELGENYIYGCEFWGGEEVDERQEIVKALLQDRTSLWNRIPWKTALQDVAPVTSPPFSAVLVSPPPAPRPTMEEPSALRFRSGSAPVVVWIQTEPWALLMGAEVPSAVLYEDGELIFSRRSAEGAKHYSRSVIGSDLKDELERRIRAVIQLQGPRHRYSVIGDVTDQPDAHLYAKFEGGEVRVSVEGLTLSRSRRLASMDLPQEELGRLPPPEVLELHRFLASEDFGPAEEWVPEFVEVVIWPYEYAREASIHWPKVWPGLESRRAVRRGKEFYSIYLDGKFEHELDALLRTQKAAGALEVDGKKWAVATRKVFPCEEIWKRSA